MAAAHFEAGNAGGHALLIGGPNLQLEKPDPGCGLNPPDGRTPCGNAGARLCS
jgi:hypothetical protein